MNVPNLLAISRVPAGLAACALLLYEPANWQFWTCVILVYAAVSDIADGYIARKLDQVSTFGAFLDLTVDKVFMCPLLFLIAGDNEILLWVAIVVMTREFLVMGLRIYAATRKAIIPAHPLGKFKTVLLFPGVFVVVIELELGGIAVGTWMLVAAAAVALISGVDYLIKARKMLEDAATAAS